MSKIENIELLLSLRKLDGYSIHIINKTLKLIQELTPQPKVISTNKNSIKLEWETDYMILELEVYEDKITVYNHCSFDGINTTNIGC